MGVRRSRGRGPWGDGGGGGCGSGSPFSSRCQDGQGKLQNPLLEVNGWRLLWPRAPRGVRCWQPERRAVLGRRCLALSVTVGCDRGFRKRHWGVLKEFPKGEHLPAVPLHPGNIIPDLGGGRASDVEGPPSWRGVPLPLPSRLLRSGAWFFPPVIGSLGPADGS